MKRRTEWYTGTLTAACSMLLSIGAMMAAPVFAVEENNVHLYGALVAEPCVVKPGDEDIPLDFGSVIDKLLYQNGRTAGQSFAIHLQGCDLSLGNRVAMTFRGTESTVLPGLLAIDGGSQARGIAIGLETTDGKALALNVTCGQYPLQAGSNVITLKAFVQGEPAALTSRSIERGAFSATATFMLAYE